jgi:hypothetical protein
MQSSSKKPGSETLKLLGSHKKPTAQSSNQSRVPPGLSAAYGRYERAKAELEAFRQKHPKIIEQYNAHRIELEGAFDEVKTKYAEHKDVVGPTYNGFAVSQKRSIDADLLVQLVPDAIALVKYTMPCGTFDKLVADGTIEEDVAEQVVTVNESITGPKK